MTTWTQTGKGDWKADCNGRTLFVRREVVKRSWAVESQFVCIGRKPRRTSSTTLVSVSVREGDVYTRLETLFSVREAKAAAVRFAMTGAGKVREVVTINDGE